MATTIMRDSETMDSPLTKGWRQWLSAWCAAITIFGLVLTGAVHPATDGPARALLAIMGNVELSTFDRPLRFTVGLMGAVTLGWGLTLAVTIPAIERLTDSDRHRAWRAMLAVVMIWFAADSGISVATGFTLNAVSNLLFVVAFVVPLVLGRALR